MHKSQKSKGGNAVFYKPAGVATEIRSGWLVKSPPSKKMKTEKSWKMRYFVLFKLSDHDHQLRYFRSATDKDRPLGGIDLSHISVLYVSPEQHPKWALIPKNLKYSPSCVLYIRTSERDYFLVGEDRSVTLLPTYMNFMTLCCKTHTTLEIYSIHSTVVFCFKDTEHEDFSGGTLMRSVTQVYEKMKTQISPLPPFDEESDTENSVTGWTGQPKTVCELQKGDQILGVNNLQVSTAEEFNMYVSKSLKNEVHSAFTHKIMIPICK
uniref:PH domain-containing protein n=1 Tax=Anabas testudineus TaxID=64144 RepID=A0A7N6BYN4_ANATE